VAKLFIVGTPIGNLEDITLRALRTLREVSLIAAEDTRKARILLQHYHILTPLTSYFEGNERQKIQSILTALEHGDVALISEAGMPGISDPGFPLILATIEKGFPVTVIPGPSAHTAALVVSGLPTDRFMFIGFLPRKKSERLSSLQALNQTKASLICYEAPHRLLASLTDIREVLGNRIITICRELTKIYEEIWRGDVETAIDWVREQAPKGEYTLVIAGALSAAEKWDQGAVISALKEHLAEGLTRSQAARKVAQTSGWSRRDVYALNINDVIPQPDP
jgi:16S rRNA (cytidine1402-2'-O)-methyltransferase